MNVQEGEIAKAGGCPFSGAFPPDANSLTDPKVIADPKKFYQAMRDQDPVYFDEKLGMYLVSRYEDIVEVLKDPITYSDKMGYDHMYGGPFREEFIQILERDGGGFFYDAIKDDPPAHTRVRRLMEKAFTAHRVATLEPGITAVIVDLIESMLDKAEGGKVVDGVKSFSVPTTIRIICEQLGIEHFNAEKIHRWSAAVTAQISGMQNREAMLENAAQVCELQNFIIAEMKAREAEPREDMISDIVHAKLEDGSTLTFKEAVSLIRANIIAGNDTTATALSNLLFLLATRPDILKTLQDSVGDERQLNRFVEELLRFAPPVQGLAKMTSREVELGGKKLPAGAHLLVMYASGNDDERVFECPRDFDTARPNLAKQVAFGVGVHRCIGIALARMEVKVAARELARRIGKIELAVPADEVQYLPTVAVHGIKELPLRLERRAA
jgi:cytochrome P450